MPIYRNTAYMTLGCHGWSESYHMDSLITNLDAVRDIMRSLWLLRAAALGSEAAIVAYSVRVEDSGNQGKVWYERFAGNQAFNCAKATKALLVRLGNQENTRSAVKYIRGIDDNASTKGGEITDSQPFTDNLQTFLDQIVESQLGWYGVDTKAKSRVTGYLADAGNYITFQVAPALPGDTWNEIVPLRFSKMNGNDPSVLNRELTCLVSADGTSAITVNPIAAQTYKGSGFVEHLTYDFVRAANTSKQKITDRKVGRCFLASPGREPARARI